MSWLRISPSFLHLPPLLLYKISGIFLDKSYHSLSLVLVPASPMKAFLINAEGILTINYPSVFCFDTILFIFFTLSRFTHKHECFFPNQTISFLKVETMTCISFYSSHSEFSTELYLLD